MKEGPWRAVPRVASPGAFSRSGLMPSPSEELGLSWRRGPCGLEAAPKRKKAFAGFSPERMRENQPCRLGFEH